MNTTYPDGILRYLRTSFDPMLLMLNSAYRCP